MDKKRNLRKGLQTLILSVVALMVIAGCTKGATEGPTAAAPAEKKPLVIAMSAANVPLPDTSPTEALEGWRFVGFQLYDGLTRWSLAQGDKPAEVGPGLAETWEVSKEDPKLWTFHLRKNVKFHDGTPFNADAVIFAMDRIKKQDSPFYNARAAASVLSYLKYIDSYKKVDDDTIQITTKEPYSYLLYDIAFILVPSPEAVTKYAQEYTNHPAGTGPFKFVSMKQGQELVMEKNEQYWGAIPKVDKVILRPMPDASSRLAALQTGDVNWAEIPPPEAVNQLKKSGFQVMLNNYPHIWTYVFNMAEGPWKDKRVRQAANYAIDREGLSKSLLNDVAKPALQLFYPGHSWYSESAVKYGYDPEKAKKLLAEAGYPNGFQTTFIVPTSGSGNMWPLPMNEFVQKNLKDIGINVKIQAIEWQTLITTFRTGFAPGTDVGAYNYSFAAIAPWAYERYYAKSSFKPNGFNVGEYSNDQLEGLLEKARQSFNPSERDGYLREAGTIVTEDAPWLFVAHDLNLRALAKNVKGFIQPQSWFADLTSIHIE
ncbi:ABC transporter substrate-binding protein [Paenibacillus agricola]|uniref:ABC transporter substrate-binding protein n=1 Tax=Paenibacillus agricola TaxID=2716264 RepID=A0ABX0JDG7_9BACL|nr:ABC transporter substrate-binding protein [Paenibacillus agricola]NHN31740.1 ABC transporter substrate-binding protein [Paenibacillus agricola]